MQPKPIDPKKTTPPQRKFLISQLGNRWYGVPEREMPPAVKKAKAVVDAWERRERQRQREGQPAYREAYEKAHQAILFGTPAEALAAVEAFTAKYRRNS